jgi:predicted Zn-dependent protease
MSRVHSRRRLMQALLAGGLALQAAPLLASESEEEAYGEAWWEAYLSGKEARVVRHPNRDAEAALQAIAAPLCRVSTRRNLHWRVGLLKVEPRNVNAFAVGAGVFFVHDALLAHCTSEADLAAVIGHEVGHIEHRHIIKRMFARQFLQRHGIDPNAGVAELAHALRNGMHAIVADEVIYRSYERQWEYQADAFAVRSLEATGYDPAQAVVMFQTLQKRHSGKADINTCIANTHPQYSDRIGRIRALARGYGARPRKADSVNFRRLMQILG